MEKLNLVKILKDCPKGTKLYSPALGECALEGVNDNNDYPIKVTYKIINNDTRFDYFTKYGYLLINKPDAECMLFPSKEQRDWNKLIVPKFKVGDSVQSKTDHNDKFTITNIDNNKFYYGCGNNHEFMIPVVKQDNWELVPNKFDITTLKPFDKVLVRDNDTSIWLNAFFGFYDFEITKKYPFVASGINWTQCIPYEGNEHLLGTYEDCDEYYKIWL